jgi:uncharacterized membrane protein YkvI
MKNWHYAAWLGATMTLFILEVITFNHIFIITAFLIFVLPILIIYLIFCVDFLWRNKAGRKIWKWLKEDAQ